MKCFVWYAGFEYTTKYLFVFMWKNSCRRYWKRVLFNQWTIEVQFTADYLARWYIGRYTVRGRYYKAVYFANIWLNHEQCLIVHTRARTHLDPRVLVYFCVYERGTALHLHSHTLTQIYILNELSLDILGW